MFRTSSIEERAMTPSTRIPTASGCLAHRQRARYRADHGGPRDGVPLGPRPRGIARGVHGSTGHRQHGGLGGDVYAADSAIKSPRATWRGSRTGMGAFRAQRSTFTDGLAGGVRDLPGVASSISRPRPPVELRQVRELHSAQMKRTPESGPGGSTTSLAAVCVWADEPIH